MKKREKATSSAFWFFSIEAVTYIVLRGEDMQNGKTIEELEKILALPVRETVQKAHLEIGKLQEIRLGAGRPLTLWYRGREMFLTPEWKY